jgi:hypothetical protein
MRMHIRILMLCALVVISSGCGGVRFGAPTAVQNSGPNWGGQVVQHTSSSMQFASDSPSTIFIQPTPVNGTFVAPPFFLSGFNAVNPFFTGCTAIVSVVNAGFVTTLPVGFAPVPTIGLIVTPIGFGSCLLPINLGFAGTVLIAITVTFFPNASRKRALQHVDSEH